ncbi:MAG: prepilin-type N-terminal cleavage/methylation domain-containing protein [Azoarcus sp.]|nr:prepilin-type N-terminal cleavage/methylation domain-containing protein [Azoarcus sp.]
MRVTGVRRRQGGFSILEVLIAFVIMAMSMAALYHAIGGSVRGFAASDDRVRAALIADSLFEMFESVPEQGVDVSGEQGERYRWRVYSEPFEVPFESPRWLLQQLHVEVRWGSGEDDRVVRLWSLRPVREEP